MTRSLRRRISSRKTRRSRKSRSGRRIRMRRSVCATRARGADRWPPENHSRRGKRPREVRRVDPPLIPRTCSPWWAMWPMAIPVSPGIGPRTAAEHLNRYGPIEELPGQPSRRTARARVALQKARDPAHRRAAFQEGRDAPLARGDASLRRLGRANGSAASAGALPKGCNGRVDQTVVNIGYLLRSHNTSKAQSVETIIPAG